MLKFRPGNTCQQVTQTHGCPWHSVHLQDKRDVKYPDQVPEAARASLHWGPGVKNCLWVFSVWMDKVISPLSTQWVTSSSPSSQAVQSLPCQRCCQHWARAGGADSCVVILKTTGIKGYKTAHQESGCIPQEQSRRNSVCHARG